MKGITRKALAAMSLVAVFGLASCTQPPANDDTTGGTGTDTTTDGGSTGTDGGSTVNQGYVVQLIASKSVARAEQIKDEFVAEGYQATVSPLNSDSGTVYRVQIGPYGTEADAQRVLDQMKRRYQQNIHVNNAVTKPVF